MHFTSSLLFIGLACAFSSAWAYPYPDPREIVNVQPEPLAYAPNFDVPLHRVRRKIHLTSDGGDGLWSAYYISPDGRRVRVSRSRPSGPKLLQWGAGRVKQHFTERSCIPLIS
ncbi:uncharacterized protein LOC6735195 [Drosophila simulans]|uniref:Uncharacterized protein n=1 Tax=Drosophila simulans TaxID=7240 RepID=A0A0J9RGA8_DROSI|nr:uncharacterized protein LOC6735195 [Drosophila simulans]KMY94962.1 uncharacterized protein Dsimw501_GD11418 [Drosophila simulans]